jgi:hypothetical protein
MWGFSSIAGTPNVYDYYYVEWGAGMQVGSTYGASIILGFGFT